MGAGRIRRAEGVASELVDGRAVLVDPGGREVLTLNPVGTLVWEAIGDDGDPAAVVDGLAARFPGIPRAQIEADVEAFMGEMRELGLIAG